MKLIREDIQEILNEWYRAWNDHDLDAVMQLFHNDVFFENWTGGRVKGKEALRRAWESWFANHGDFKFIEEETFIDETTQKALYRWALEWPSHERGFDGGRERRRGVDVIHFRDGKIINKITYSKTCLDIDHKRVLLRASLSNEGPAKSGGSGDRDEECEG